MNQENVCYSCFCPLPENASGSCSNCGYDPEQDEGKYPLALPHGTVLNGRYITGRVLGQGGFGVTYVAQDWKTKERVAIKEYLPDTLVIRAEKNTVSAHSGQREESFLYGKECFLKEAETLAEFIGNPNIVRIHSYFEENMTAYFVMDYVEGISFQSYIEEHGGKISWQEAEKFLLPIMDALGAVHAKGIIHRDVTPDNIFITKDGTVKLLDFGAARYSLGDKSRSLDVVLKHGFAPKEQYTRHGRQGPYTDIYTIAASFYYAITGRKPPDSIDRLEDDDLALPSSLGCDLPEQIENAILKGMEVQPIDRYQSMADFKQALAVETMQGDQTTTQKNAKSGEQTAAQTNATSGEQTAAQTNATSGGQTAAQTNATSGGQTAAQTNATSGGQTTTQTDTMPENQTIAQGMEQRKKIVFALCGFAGVAMIALVCIVIKFAFFSGQEDSVPAGSGGGGTKNELLAQMYNGTPDEENEPAADSSEATSEPEVTPTPEAASEETEDEDETYQGAATPEEALGNYLEFFVEAVNSGDYSDAYRVMDYGSEIYNQQLEVIKNLHSRGIRENLRNYYVKSTKRINSTTVDVTSQEEIAVTFLDGTKKTVRQSYCYRCINTSTGYLFTKMSETKSNSSSSSTAAKSNKQYILPDVARKYYPASTFKKMTARELRLARNEIYARHGYIFKDKELRKYFKKKSWYRPRKKDVSNSSLNRYEKENLKMIQKYEKRR